MISARSVAGRSGRTFPERRVRARRRSFGLSAVLALLGLGAVLLGGCSTSAPLPVPDPALADAGPVDPKACRACEAWADPEDEGFVESNELSELSGLAASRTTKGVLYTHNDSGDTARFFALGPTGALQAVLVLDGVKANDIEDIAVGPCPEGSCVFLGDIGDNDEKRKTISIYRVKEPSLTNATLTPSVLVLTYPDGAHNAETLLVSPEGDLVIVTKTPTGRSGAYALGRAEVASAREATLRRIGDVIVPKDGGGLVTGGSFHPCEKRVVLRTYTALFEYRFAGGLETLFASPPTLLPAGREPQGEAVTYSADGTTIYTVSEGKRPPLHAKRCAP